MVNSEQRLTDSWASATWTLNYVFRNPLIDQLGRYGESKGLVREFAPFIMQEGIEFDLAHATYLDSQAHLIAIATSREKIRDLSATSRADHEWLRPCGAWES